VVETVCTIGITDVKNVQTAGHGVHSWSGYIHWASKEGRLGEDIEISDDWESEDEIFRW
jgi:hypothetical protein